MSKLQALKDQFEAAQKRMQAEGKVALEEALAEVFANHPKLQAVRWTQYTPYFNDGEACVFSVNSPYIKFEGLEEDAGDYEDGFEYCSSYRNDERPEGFVAAANDVSEVFNSIPDELMLSVFEDHVQVTATRKGFEVEEHSHD